MADPKKDQEKMVNPIDPDKVAENPHILPYSHNVGGVEIKPVDKGRVKGRAVEAMYQQTDQQLDQIKEQIELLAKQAKGIQDRISISEKIYQADINFEPLIGFVYHLYQKDDGSHVVSMVGPDEWGPKPPYTFIASAKMLADHTWEVLEE
jgi:hypothetical protein